MSDYKPRIADALLKRKLAGKGAVLIQGPKWCGKTTTAEQIAASVIYLDAPDQLREVKIKADINPQELLAGATPRLLDEWQIVPQLWDTIRYEADHRKGFGHFILTGSSEMNRQSIFCHCAICRLGKIVYLCIPNGELAQLARALAWHARGHEFDSRILHL